MRGCIPAQRKDHAHCWQKYVESFAHPRSRSRCHGDSQRTGPGLEADLSYEAPGIHDMDQKIYQEGVNQIIYYQADRQ